MIDFTEFTAAFVGAVVLACLVVGYIIKHASFLKWIPNDDIPVILAIFGAVCNALYSGVTFDNIVLGAVMGLASTGAHQRFKAWVEKEEAKKIANEPAVTE